MKRALAAVSLLFLFPFAFSETITPPALKVRQICGTAFIANGRIELRREPHGKPIAIATTDNDGKFIFQSTPAGRVYLAVPGYAIQDWFPLDVHGPLNSNTCKHPLYVRPTMGSESAILVSLKKE
ncbi:MAG TPA: hypothetical protein VGS02_09625 [Acidobacteriaceae bacterium]|nr:hypothetical protein [Acidobacteriaceae bacterium]